MKFHMRYVAIRKTGKVSDLDGFSAFEIVKRVRNATRVQTNACKIFF